MDWFEEMLGKLRRRNQILFGKDSACLQELAMLLQGQEHRTVTLWAFDLAEESVAELERRLPGERRPRAALEAAEAWAAGKIKMREAQRRILDCHAVAKELDCEADIAVCHAVGQACAVVHTAGHALGYPIYDLTAIVRRLGPEGCREAVERRCREYADRLLLRSGQAECDDREWADFLRGPLKGDARG